jgi:FkbM family methyltransferase
MAEVTLVEFDDGLRLFASSQLEVRFLHEEIFGSSCYVFDLPARPFVIDVGANIGMFSLFVKLQHPDAAILAFEPVPEIATVLRRNIELHRLSAVDVREVALGSRAERDVPFTYYPALPGNSTRYPEQKEQAKAMLRELYSARVAERLYQGQSSTVCVQPLSAYLSDRPVDLLKVDVEGAELDVLTGIDEPHWPLIRQVSLEVHDQDGRLARICELLSARGLTPRADIAPMTDPAAGDYLVHAVRLPDSAREQAQRPPGRQHRHHQHDGQAQPDRQVAELPGEQGAQAVGGPVERVLPGDLQHPQRSQGQRQQHPGQQHQRLTHGGQHRSQGGRVAHPQGQAIGQRDGGHGQQRKQREGKEQLGWP